MAQDQTQELIALRQQVMALASVIGVLVTALRRGGLMTDELETLLRTDLCDAAASQSELARIEWERIVAAVQKVAAGAAPLA